MKKSKNSGFTLIELIAVLVIMAIIALIVTPLVMNIIRSARVSADKRSVDAYGRSIELAVASYLLDNGRFPTDVNQLTIEYSGNEVVCSTTQLNSDSSVYLSGCTVAGRTVSEYTYGSDKTPPVPTYTAYSIGDIVTYNSINYYVIENSDTTQSTVTLLKAEPLSYEEIQIYSAGTGASTSNQNGYAGMSYHSSSNNYETSFIKITVDAWAADKVPQGLQEARLLSYDDLFDNLGYEIIQECSAGNCSTTQSHANTPSWVYNYYDYQYWTMIPKEDSTSLVGLIFVGGTLDYSQVGSSNCNYKSVAVRPVITLSKSVLES